MSDICWDDIVDDFIGGVHSGEVFFDTDTQIVWFEDERGALVDGLVYAVYAQGVELGGVSDDQWDDWRENAVLSAVVDIPMHQGETWYMVDEPVLLDLVDEYMGSDWENGD